MNFSWDNLLFTQIMDNNGILNAIVYGTFGARETGRSTESLDLHRTWQPLDFFS